MNFKYIRYLLILYLKFWLSEKIITFTFFLFYLATIIAYTTFNNKLIAQIVFTPLSFILFMYYILDKKLEENHFFSVFSISPFMRHLIKTNLIFTACGILYFLLNLAQPLFQLNVTDLLVVITSCLFTCVIYQPQNILHKGLVILIGNLLIITSSILGVVFTSLILIVLVIHLIKIILNEQSI
jgi:hypothetical protein